MASVRKIEVPNPHGFSLIGQVYGPQYIRGCAARFESGQNLWGPVDVVTTSDSIP